jgi:hypothetical protein
VLGVAGDEEGVSEECKGMKESSRAMLPFIALLDGLSTYAFRCDCKPTLIYLGRKLS